MMLISNVPYIVLLFAATVRTDTLVELVFTFSHERRFVCSFDIYHRYKNKIRLFWVFHLINVQNRS